MARILSEIEAGRQTYSEDTACRSSRAVFCYKHYRKHWVVLEQQWRAILERICQRAGRPFVILRGVLPARIRSKHSIFCWRVKGAKRCCESITAVRLSPQVIDLEASVKGWRIIADLCSGLEPGIDQPSQRQFESGLAAYGNGLLLALF